MIEAIPLIFALCIAAVVALCVIVVEIADRQKIKAAMQARIDRDVLLNELSQAERQHKPRKHIRKAAIEAVRRELAL